MQQDGATRRGRVGELRFASARRLLSRLGWSAEPVSGPLRETLERELADRAGFQWLAVAFGSGALLYFALPREPTLSGLLAPSLLAAVTAFVLYQRGNAWRAATVLALILAGVTTAKLRVDSLAGPQIERAVSVELTGRVLNHERRTERRPRILLDQLEIGKLAPAETPGRIRVTIGDKYAAPPLGARIVLRARLMPVAGPAVPSGYDPRRAAFFDGIGGSGFALGGWTLAAPPPRFGWDLAITRIRAAIVARIMAAEPGETGAVAAALLVGERSALSAETNESLRLSGLAHILSISGLHMMLIAGTAFFLVRGLLALSPRLALAYPIRKWAACAALVTVTCYLALSGGGVATVRAYVMAAIMFLAILADRPAISMRNLAIAAFVVLAIEPESIVEPGFQMSFAAVAALIATWEAWQARRRDNLGQEDLFPGFRLIRTLGRAAFGVCLTSLVAGLATAPFAAYHFERVATFSLLGNLLAAPVVSAIIMPFGLLTLLAMPFGLEALPLNVMGWGIATLLRISDWVAALPGADVRAPHLGPASLLLITVGLLWICLWRLRWRLLGLLPLASGVAIAPLLGNPADILVTPDGLAVAVRDSKGALRVSGSRAGSYTVEQFFEEEANPAPDEQALREGVRCDPVGCILSGGDAVQIAHVRDAAGFLEDCRRAAIVIAPLNVPPDCRVRLAIGRPELEQFGAHAVRIRGTQKAPHFELITERTAFPRPWQAGGLPQPEASTSAEDR